MARVYGIGGLVNTPPEVLTGFGAPPSNFRGALGQLYYDTSTSPYTEYTFNGTSFAAASGGTTFATNVQAAAQVATGVALQPSNIPSMFSTNFLPATQGGTGLSSPAANQLLVTNGASAMTQLGVAADGAIPIGATAGAPVLATITAGANVSVVNAANSITISASVPSSITWQAIAASQAMAVNNGYACTGGGSISLSLPAVSAVGDILEVTLDGSTDFTITQGAGQSVRMGNQATSGGVAGSLASTASGDSLKLVCSFANTRWNVLSSMGNITIV